VEEDHRVLEFVADLHSADDLLAEGILLQLEGKYPFCPDRLQFFERGILDGRLKFIDGWLRRELLRIVKKKIEMS
jgi:hypothetical protein